MRFVDAKLLNQEDGAALVAHPDAVLESGQRWECSCGETRLTMTALHTSWAGDQPAYAWCSKCGDTARWDPIVPPRAVVPESSAPSHIPDGAT